MKTITIKIKKDGTSTVEVEGVMGPSCKDITESIVQTVGVVRNSQETDDYYKTPPEFEFLNRSDMPQ